MNKRRILKILVVLGAISLLVIAILSRPNAPKLASDPASVKETRNPLDVPLLQHMREDGLDVGPEPGHQLVIEDYTPNKMYERKTTLSFWRRNCSYGNGSPWISSTSATTGWGRMSP